VEGGGDWWLSEPAKLTGRIGKGGGERSRCLSLVWRTGQGEDKSEEDDESSVQSWTHMKRVSIRRSTRWTRSDDARPGGCVARSLRGKRSILL
jgi:hypothetical protein